MLGTVVSVGFTVALARRWRTSRRPFLRSWTIALAAFSTGIGALAYGAAVGFDEPVVRVYYVFGALLAAPWLGLGEVELLGSPRLTRWAGLGLALLLVPAALVVAVQPLRAPVPGGFAVPDGSVLFAPLSRGLVATSNIAGTLAVVGGVVVSGVRARGQGLAARSRFAGACLIGLGVLVAAGAGTAAGLGVPGLQPVVLAVGVGVMYAGFRQTLRRVGRHRMGDQEWRRAERARRQAERVRRRLPPVPPPAPLPQTVLAAPHWGGAATLDGWSGRPAPGGPA